LCALVLRAQFPPCPELGLALPQLRQANAAMKRPTKELLMVAFVAALLWAWFAYWAYLMLAPL
jgi:hypothetical protein